jgi:WD40 repeat protein
MIAVCPTNNEIWIFEANNQEDISKWTKIAVLKEHFNVISSLDWHPKTNLLMSASTDRGVIVWAPGDVKGEFSPQIGMIKEQRANLDAVWNTRGDIFAVATSSGDVHIGTYSSQNNFWVAHPFNAKKPIHKASVLCVRFDPLSGRVVASSSLDGTVVITSCYKSELEFDSAGPFGKISTYG